MARILSIARCQLRLLVRSPLFLAAAVAILVIVTATAVDYTDNLPTPPSEAMETAVGQMLPVQLLVFTLLAAAAGVSARSGRAAEMTDTYRHSNAEMAAGHTLGLAAAFAAVQTLAVAWVIPLVWTRYGRLPLDLTTIREMLAFRVAPSSIQCAGVGYLIGLGLGSPVVAYPVAAGAWFLGTIGSVQATVLPATRWLCMLDAGTGQGFDLPMLARVWVALGLTAAGLAATVVKRRRESARTVRAGATAWLLAAAVLFAGAMVDDWRVWSFRRGMSDLFVAAASADTEALAQAPAAELALRPATDVLSYDMGLYVDAREKSIANTVTMQVANSGPEPIDRLTFTLRGSVFKVEDCQIAMAGDSWSQAGSEQEGSLVQVLLSSPLQPGASCGVRVSYHGLVQDWTLGRFGPYGTELNAIVMPGYTWVPSGAGWYPIGGARATRFVVSADLSAAKSSEQLRMRRTPFKAVWLENSHPAARMHVVVHIDDSRLAAGVDMGILGRRISGPSESPVYEFESESARDLYLAADRFYVDDAGLTDLGRSYLDRRWLFYEQLAPSGVEMRVAILPKLGPQSFSSRLAPPGVATVSESAGIKAIERLARGIELVRAGGLSADRELAENAVLAAWWPTGATRGDEMSLDDSVNAIEGVKRYALVMFMEASGEGTRAEEVLRQALAPTVPGGFDGPVFLEGINAASRQAMTAIHVARQDYGDGVVRAAYRVLRRGRPGRDGIVTLADLASAFEQAVREEGRGR